MITVVYAPKRKMMQALEVLSCAQTDKKVLLLEYDDLAIRLRGEGLGISVVSDPVKSESFSEMMNLFVQTMFPNEGLFQMMSLEGASKSRFVSEIREVGGFNEYLKEPYWVFEDLNSRIELLLPGRSLNSDGNPFIQSEDIFDADIARNQFTLLWQIPLDVVEKDYRDYIRGHFKWSEAFNEKHIS